MKFHIHKNGLTLTELLIASIIIGIVMLGVVSFSYTVTKMEGNTGKATQVKVRAATYMLQIKQDLTVATGDPSNPGIYVHTQFDGTNPHASSVCVRHDIDNPISYADDQWICYHHGSSFGVSRFVWDPGFAPPFLDDPPGPGPCHGNDCGYNQPNATEYFHFMTLSDNPPPENHFVRVVDDTGDPYDGVGNVVNFEINIEVRFDPDSAPDPIDNPEYKLSTNVLPPAHSGPIDASDILEITSL